MAVYDAPYDGWKEWITSDRHHARFPGLRWHHPVGKTLRLMRFDRETGMGLK